MDRKTSSPQTGERIERVISLFRMFFKRMGEDEATGRAAQLAYFFLLSIFPFMIFATTLLAYLNINDQDLIQVLGRYLPDQIAPAIKENIRTVLQNRHRGLLSIGLVATFWTASAAVRAMISSLNRVYGVRETRSFFKRLLISLLLTLALAFTIPAALILSVLGQIIGWFVASTLHIVSFATAWEIIRWALSFVIMTCTLILVYRIAPNCRLGIREILPGTLVATVGWLTASFGFGYYLGHFAHYSATYGSLGSAIILMVWFYLIGILIIVGGEINAMLRSSERNEPLEH